MYSRPKQEREATNGLHAGKKGPSRRSYKKETSNKCYSVGQRALMEDVGNMAIQLRDSLRSVREIIKPIYTSKQWSAARIEMNKKGVTREKRS